MGIITKRTEKFTQASFDDEVMIMREHDGKQFGLEGTGEQIWRLIDGSRDRDQIVEELARIYGVEPREIADDVHAFLVDLKNEGLIEVR